MRLVLLAVGLIASVNALSVSTQSKIANYASSADHALFQDDQTDMETKRSLRAGKSTEEKRDGKERRSIRSVLSKLTEVFNLSKTQITKREELAGVALEKQQKYLERKFVKLHLDKAKKDLFKNPNMEKWVKLRKKYNAQHGIEDTSEIDLVSKNFLNEMEWAGMIENARRNKKTHNMAMQFQADQLKKWLQDEKDPREVYKLLFVKNVANRTVWKTYRNMYNEQVIKKLPTRTR